jgi:hypothetical protein
MLWKLNIGYDVEWQKKEEWKPMTCDLLYLEWVYFFFIILSRVRLSPLGFAATTGLLYKPQMIGDNDCGEIVGMKIGRGNRSTRRKPSPSATLSTTNPTWLDPGSNPGRHDGKPATNRLSYGAALNYV